jgi:hypothetical protein
MLPYHMVSYSKIQYSTGTVLYGTCTVRQGDVWITIGDVITNLIRSFELSKDCSKIRVHV